MRPPSSVRHPLSTERLRSSAMKAVVAPFRPELLAPGVGAGDFVPAVSLEELPPGAMRRVTLGDLDVLLAHTETGIVAVDDRCPHMSAPLSIGTLEGCIVACPLHEGRFDLASGEPVQMPTTGGLDPDGRYHPTWSPLGREAKVDPPGLKAEARRLTRVRRIRYYPVRIDGGRIEVAVPRRP
jgi:3-phenylpropionate/trans-cinnamate dioxygenase ferredoxin component